MASKDIPNGTINFTKTYHIDKHPNSTTNQMLGKNASGNLAGSKVTDTSGNTGTLVDDGPVGFYVPDKKIKQ